MELLIFVAGAGFAVMAFGLTVFLHELGHFAAAKLCRIEVPEFSVGFGRVLLQREINGTVFRVRLFPLGGFVILPALDDSTKLSLGRRLFIILSGPLASLGFAAVLAFCLWVIGRPSMDRWDSTVVGYVEPQVRVGDRLVVSPAKEGGLLPGDRIVSVNGRAVASWMDIWRTVQTSSRRTIDDRVEVLVRVKRAQEELDLSVHPVSVRGRGRSRIMGAHPEESLQFIGILPGSAAYQAGIREGDILTGVDRLPVRCMADVKMLPAGQGPHTVEILVLRNGARMVFYLPRHMNLGGELSVHPVVSIRHENPIATLVHAITSATNLMGAVLNPNTAIGLADFSGPLGMGVALQSFFSFDLRLGMWLVMILNVNLFLINMLPLTFLDGGQAALAVIRRYLDGQVLDTVIRYANGLTITGMVAVFVYITVIDIARVMLNF